MLKRVPLLVAGLVVIGAVILFVLDRTIFAPVAVSQQLPTAPTLVPAVDSATAGAPANTDSAKQLYRIDASQSEVRYQVNETFFTGNRLNTAIGRTKGIAGDIQVDTAHPADSQIGDIVIDVSQFTSDESRRDNFIRRSNLESGTYPTATFVTKSIDGLPASVKVGDELNLKVTGDLTVKQTTKPVTWDLTLKVEDGKLTGSASTQITMSEFGVGPIQIPMLATEDNVKLFFDFVATPVRG